MRVLLAAVKCVNYLCLCAYYVNFLSALDSNDAGFSEEGEVFEYQEEYQGQDDQVKPSKLVAYLILVLLTACFINVYENACFYIAITSR
jgi:hypothetical protein